MTLQQICVSLELAQQLKEAGYPQESLFYWVQTKLAVQSPAKWELSSIAPIEKYGALSPFGWFAAPTASEIGEQLPKRITASAKLSNSSSRDVPREYMLIMGYDNGKYFLRYRIVEDYLGYTPEINDDSEANARAKMYLYLKIKGLLTSPNQA